MESLTRFQGEDSDARRYRVRQPGSSLHSIPRKISAYSFLGIPSRANAKRIRIECAKPCQPGRTVEMHRVNLHCRHRNRKRVLHMQLPFHVHLCVRLFATRPRENYCNRRVKNFSKNRISFLLSSASQSVRCTSLSYMYIEYC